mmetsp:Transcript_95368/g.179313  ORF Transcript_95368/g.179313 Transcript_95368/m.179313 type:complete len:3377 (+) Transcript_95368:49-10179(+)
MAPPEAEPERAKKVQREFPWCTLFLVVSALICHTLVLLGNVTTARSFAAIGKSTNGWSNVGLNLAQTLTSEMDVLMTTMTEKLTGVLENVLEVKEGIDNAFYTIGNATDSVLAMSTTSLQELRAAGHDPSALIKDKDALKKVITHHVLDKRQRMSVDAGGKLKILTEGVKHRDVVSRMETSLDTHTAHLRMLQLSDTVHKPTHGSCLTVNRDPCIFPFIYDGIVNKQCSYQNSSSGNAWCATAIDSRGEYAGKWGTCGSTCRVENAKQWSSMSKPWLNTHHLSLAETHSFQAPDWTCHHYAAGQDDEWCSRGHIEGGFQYSYNGGAFNVCGGCWCCKRQFIEEARLFQQEPDTTTTTTDGLAADAAKSGICMTTEGKRCIFPFTYAGNVFNGCTDSKHFRYWCATEVDSEGVFVSGKWGNCADECEALKRFDDNPMKVAVDGWLDLGSGCCSGTRSSTAGRIWTGIQPNSSACSQKCEGMDDCGFIEYGFTQGDENTTQFCTIWSSSKSCDYPLDTGSKDCEGKGGNNGVHVFKYVPEEKNPSDTPTEGAAPAPAVMNFSNGTRLICPKPTKGCSKRHDKYTKADCDGDGIEDHICQSTISSRQLYLVLSSEGCNNDWGTKYRQSSECPYQQLEEAHAGSWVDVGAGCCAGGRGNEHGRMFADQMDTLKECQDTCAAWDECGYVEYGWGQPDPKWCFVWSYKQECAGLAAEPDDCGGRGGDNGVRVYKFAPTTTTTTRLSSCAKPTTGCDKEFEVSKAVDCDDDGIWDYMCTSVISDKMSLVLSSEGCPKDWGSDNRKKSECAKGLEKTPGGDWVDLGAGCCSSPRDNKHGRMFAAKLPSLKHCQARCATWKDCAYIEYGWEQDPEWCFIWNQKQTLCDTLNSSANGCGTRGGNTGVRTYKYEPPPVKNPRTLAACPRPKGCDQSYDIYTKVDCDGDDILDHMCTDEEGSELYLVLSTEGCPKDWGEGDRKPADCPEMKLHAAYSGDWTDLGEGCCAGGRQNEHGRMYADRIPTLSQCQDRCAGWKDCGFIEYGWGKGDTEWCFIWSNKFQQCKELDRGEKGCGNRGGDNGVHVYKFTPVSNGSSIAGCARPKEGCDDESQIYKTVDCDADGILDHFCQSTTSDDRFLVLSGEGCPTEWDFQKPRTEKECPDSITSVDKEEWEDLGAGCCTGPRDNKAGRMYAGELPTLEYCFAKCASWKNCGIVEYGWGGKDSKWCFIWSSKQNCTGLDKGSKDCGKGGNTGVRSWRYTPKPKSMAVTAACPRPPDGCLADTDIYAKVDCDGDGILDHMCTSTEDKSMSLVLSTEKCPDNWGSAARMPYECPEIQLGVAKDGDWVDLGEGCCTGGRHNEHGRMFADRLPTLEHCQSRCASWEDCGFIEYGWTRGDMEWCFIWNKKFQECPARDTGVKDCGGRGGENGVRVYQFVPITTTTTTSTTSKTLTFLTAANCKADELWCDLGAGCCSDPREDLYGRMYAGEAASLEACQAKCAGWSNCGVIEFGWTGKDEGWCFIWSDIQSCPMLNGNPGACSGRGGDTGVHSWKYNPKADKSRTTPAPTPCPEAEPITPCSVNAFWCDLGAGCCASNNRDVPAGMIDQVATESLQECKQICEKSETCIFIEYGYTNPKTNKTDQTCFMWNANQPCAGLFPQKDKCGGLGGDNGVHVYKYNRFLTTTTTTTGPTTEAPPPRAPLAEACSANIGDDAYMACVFPFMYKGAVNEGCSMQDHYTYWCATKIDDDGMMVPGYMGNCQPACKDLGFLPEPEESPLVEGSWTDLGEGCCDAKRDKENGMLFYGSVGSLKKCKDLCESMQDCGAVEYGYGAGDKEFCFIWSQFQPCRRLSTGFTDCEGRGGNNGVHVHQFSASTTTTTTTFVDDGMCRTAEGKLCVFPFIVDGVVNTKCSIQNHYTFWCATKVDEGRSYQRGYWGECNSACKKWGYMEPSLMDPIAGDWTDIGEGCCKEEVRDDEHGRLFSGPMPSLKHCQDRCATWENCAWVEYGWKKEGFEDWCFIWSTSQPCDGRATGASDCNEKGGDNGVRVYRFDPTQKATTLPPATTTTTATLAIQPAPVMTPAPTTTTTTSWIPPPTTTLKDDPIPAAWCQNDTIWCDIGAGCCKADRDDGSGLLWEGDVKDENACKDMCAQWRNCGVIEFGYDKGKSSYCAIWSDLQPCPVLDTSKKGCNKGGDNGVRSHRFNLDAYLQAVKMEAPAPAEPTPLPLLVAPLTCDPPAAWCDLGRGCCQAQRNPGEGMLWNGTMKSLDACKAKCKEFKTCGAIEYGWGNLTVAGTADKKDDKEDGKNEDTKDSEEKGDKEDEKKDEKKDEKEDKEKDKKESFLQMSRQKPEEDDKKKDKKDDKKEDKEEDSAAMEGSDQDYGTWCFIWSAQQECLQLNVGSDGCGGRGGDSGVHVHQYDPETERDPPIAPGLPGICERPSTGCENVTMEAYSNLDCDGDGILDHMCTLPGNPAARWLVLSTNGCPNDWGLPNRSAVECTCSRPVQGCVSPYDTYANFDCDGDGILDHACQNAETGAQSLVLSSEGCPNEWGPTDRDFGQCKTLTTTTTTSAAYCCIGALDISLYEGRALRETHGSEDVAQEVDTIVGLIESGEWKGLVHGVLLNVTEKAVGVVNDGLKRFFTLIHPALLQIGKWLIQFGEKIQTTIEGFGNTIDKVQKIIDQVMASLAGSKGKEQVEYDTYTLFDMSGSGYITIDDLKLVGEAYGIQALDGDKVEALFTKYDQNSDSMVTEAEFSRMVEDDSVPGCMCVVLRAFSKRLAQIAGNVKAARLRDEVAKAVMEYLTHISAKNKTKVQWVSDRLTNGSIPMAFSADVFKQLAMAVDDPANVSNVDVGQLVITEMVTLKPEYVSDTLKLMSDPKFWESEGFDPTDQPTAIERVTAWVANATATVGDATALMHMLPTTASFQEISMVLPAMPMMARETVQQRARRYRSAKKMAHAAKIREFKAPNASKLLFDLFLGGAAASSSNDDPTAKESINSGVMAKPETLEFAQFLSWNASATAKRFQDQCMDYMGDSSSALDSFANQIQAMTKKMANFLKMMMAYATPTGIKKLEDQIQEFVKNAAASIVQIIEDKLLGPTSNSEANGKGSVLLGMPRQVPEGAVKVVGQIFTVINTVLTALQGALPSVIADLKYARKEVSAVAAQLNNIFGMVKLKGPPIFDLVAALYQTLWTVYFIFFAALTLGLLFYGFWASGYLGGPEASDDDSYEPPVTFKERVAACWRSCMTCMAACHDTALCFWSCIICMEVIVLVLFIVAIILTLLSGIKAFINAGCSQIYLLGDASICTGVLGQVQTWLVNFWSGGSIANVCNSEYLMTCQLIVGKMKQSVMFTTVGSMMAAVLSFQMIIQSAILHEQARWRRIADGLEKDV